MTQNGENSLMYNEKITRLDFFEKPKQEHYVYLRAYLSYKFSKGICIDL